VGEREGFGVRGEGLGAQQVEFFGYQIFIFPRFLDSDVPDRIGWWWGILGSSFAQRREDAKVFSWMPEKAECQSWPGPLMLGGFAPLRESFRCGFGKEDVVSCSLIPIITDSA
jgi:hypothetical protein